jgi:hypothetical protein
MKHRFADRTTADEVETLFWINEWLFYTALLACPPSLVAMWMRWDVL